MIPALIGTINTLLSAFANSAQHICRYYLSITSFFIKGLWDSPSTCLKAEFRGGPAQQWPLSIVATALLPRSVLLTCDSPGMNPSDVPTGAHTFVSVRLAASCDDAPFEAMSSSEKVRHLWAGATHPCTFALLERCNRYD